MHKYLLVCTVLFIAQYKTIAQNDTLQVLFSGYAEAYYQFDFDQPENHQRPGFLYNHTRTNEVNINLAFLKAAVSSSRMRANLAAMAGTYVDANLAAETGGTRHLLEANIGYRMSKKHQVWLDLGVMPSHIGFESAISADCATPSRSLVAENSPYFETGAKLSYQTKNEKWNLSLLALNGWQRIRRLDATQKICLGMQANYKPNAKWQLNYSNFFGSVQPDSLHFMRHYHNLYAVWNSQKRLAVTLGFDLGSDLDTDLNGPSWWTPVAIARVQLHPKWYIAGRAEYFADPNQVVIAVAGAEEIALTGFSCNLDYAPIQNGLIRMEVRGLYGRDAIFGEAGKQKKENISLLLSSSIKF